MDSDKQIDQALRTLRGIRRRYEEGRSTGSDYLRPYTVQVALDYADMLWIAAVIKTLEKGVVIAERSFNEQSETNAHQRDAVNDARAFLQTPPPALP